MTTAGQSRHRQATAGPAINKDEREERPRRDPVLLKALKANLRQASEPLLRQRLAAAIAKLRGRQ